MQGVICISGLVSQEALCAGPAYGSRHAQLYNPGAAVGSRWSAALADSLQDRLYHSNAMLTVNGEVILSGVPAAVPAHSLSVLVLSVVHIETKPRFWMLWVDCRRLTGVHDSFSRYILTWPKPARLIWGTSKCTASVLTKAAAICTAHVAHAEPADLSLCPAVADHRQREHRELQHPGAHVWACSMQICVCLIPLLEPMTQMLWHACLQHASDQQ